MNDDQAPRPGMPGIEKLANFRPVGVATSYCTMSSARMGRSGTRSRSRSWIMMALPARRR